MAKRLLAFGDAHFPTQNETAIEIVKKVARDFAPDLAVSLGDILDCKQFSVHPGAYGEPDSQYEDDLFAANKFLDDIAAHTKGRLVLVEGNHEYRIDRWAARAAEGRGSYTMLAPRLQLMRHRDKTTYIPYGSRDGCYPHYKINNRIMAVHGWSYAIHATKEHLRKSQGKSVLHGHTHRLDASTFPNVWGGGTITAMSSGCLCQPIPTYGTGTPVDWVNAFIIGYLGRTNDTLFQIPIRGNFCVMPDGKEIRV